MRQGREDASAGGGLVTDVRAELSRQPADSYRELLSVPALSLGLFAVSAGYADVQDPHGEDEVYVVVEGEAVLEVAGERTAVSAGSFAYVPAGVAHRFLDVSSDLRVVVVFAPPET